jgi:hypothetical protein
MCVAYSHMPAHIYMNISLVWKTTTTPYPKVTVEAGIKVGALCEILRQEANLTLQNLASIAEQQVGGFIQVGAHGTGASIPPVDMQVVSMKLITPALGVIEVSETNSKHLFDLAKVNLKINIYMYMYIHISISIYI